MVAINSLGNKKLALLAALTAIVCMAGTASAQAQNLEKSFANVVMIEGKIERQPGLPSSFGAGIVIGSRAGRIYIATANHVVRTGGSRPVGATDIKVQFRFLPGEKFPARLLDTRNKSLDLAVLSVKASADAIPPAEFNYKVLGNSGSLKRGSNVHPLGNPANQNWGVSIAPEKVDSIRATEIVFQSSYIQKGHSGGALLDGCGDIVGLIRSDSPPTGKAVRIESILDALREWNYPTDIEASGGCAPSVRTQRPAVPQTSTPGRAIPVDQDSAPVTLMTGTSEKFVIVQAQGHAIFLFTPEDSAVHKISALSEPDRVDVAWVIVNELGTPIKECDNDYPSRGTELCAVDLEGGQTYRLVVANLTGDETGEPSEPVVFTITIRPEY